MKRAITLAWACLLAVAAHSHETPADLILVNGKVFTVDVSRPSAEAIAIRGERIIAIGASADVERFAAPQTRRIDLGGRLVIPGVNDAHYHYSPPASGVRLPFKTMNPSWEDVRRELAAAAKTTPAEQWIFGSVGHEIVLDQTIDRAALDELALRQPVLLTAFYGHGYIANSRALARLGLGDSKADPYGGRFERDADGRINGRFWEYAQWRPARDLAQQVDTRAALAALREMSDQAVGFGVTSMQAFSTLPIDRFTDLLVQAKLPIRVRAIPFSLTRDAARDLSEVKRLEILANPSAKVAASGIKWVLDGTPFERGAHLRRDYADRPGWRGSPNFPATEIARMLDESLSARQQLLVHAVGDATISGVFDAMERKQHTTAEWASKRLRIEHGDGLIDDLIPRARRLGVIVVQNPTHFADADFFRARWGGNMQPLKSLIDNGVHVALGSDGALNPYLNVMFATLHPANPGEAITRERALRAYTFGSAYAEFAEKDKGMLAPGMLADIAVLSQDVLSIPTPALPATHSVLTIVGGQIVHHSIEGKRGTKSPETRSPGLPN